MFISFYIKSGVLYVEPNGLYTKTYVIEDFLY